MTYEQFYKTQAWVKCRNAYLKMQGGLCERCFAAGKIVPAEVVHHKQYLDEDKINNPELALNFENLEALCWSHHEQEHQRWHKGNKIKKRYVFDESGKLIIYPPGATN